jgi:hypothetical protein
MLNPCDISVNDMFDGAKHLSLSAPVKTIMTNPRLKFQGKYYLDSSEDIPGRAALAQYQSWRFRAHRSSNIFVRVEAEGSYHRYHNDGRHNYDDFRRIHLARTIENMRTDLCFLPRSEKLNNIEFGVNIKLDFSVTQVLESLLTYKGIPFLQSIDNPFYYQCETKEFIIKIYDKGRQFKLRDNILRFEIKVRSMNYLKTKNIHINFLSDLLNQENYQSIGQLLQNCFSAILFRDLDLDRSNLTQEDKQLYYLGCLRESWKRPKRSDFSSQRNYDRTRKSQSRLEHNFRVLYTPSFQKKLEEMICQKWQYLTTTDQEEEEEISDIRSRW